MLQEGKLVRWNDDRGFGFVRLDDGSEVFLHISALRQIERRPQVSDEVIFEIGQGGGGRKQAVNAAIRGVSSAAASQPSLRPAQPSRQKPETAHRRSSGQPQHRPKFALGGRLWPMLILVAGIYGYIAASPRIQAWLHPYVPPAAPSQMSEAIAPPAVQDRDSLYACTGKTHCSQMSSCAEAIYYLTHCPFPQMDGDGDGIPCEQQWCSY